MQTLTENCALSLIQQATTLDHVNQACIAYAFETKFSDYTLVKVDHRFKQTTPATLFTNKHFKVSALFTTHSYNTYKPALKISQQQITPFVEINNNSRFLRAMEYHDLYSDTHSLTPLHINLYFPFHVRYQYTGFFMLSGVAPQNYVVQENIVHGKLFADYLADKISVLQKNIMQPRVKLTEKERLCLYILADGGTNEDIGRAIGVSPVTVTYHIKKLINKFHARSRFQALALAISDGEVPTKL